MEEQKMSSIIGMTLAAVVCIIVVVAVAIPIFSGTTNEIRSIGTNEDARYYLEESSNPSMTIKYADSKYMVGDLDVTSLHSGRTILACCDSFVVFCYSSFNGLLVISDELTSYETTNTITVANGKISYTASGVAKERTIDGKFIYASSLTSGKYGGYEGDINGFKFNDDTVFRGYSVMPLANADLDPTSISPISGIVGTYDELEFYGTAVTAYTYSWNTTPSESDEDYLTIVDSSLTVNGTDTTGTYTADDIAVIWVVPLNYLYESTQDSAMSSMVNIIPLLLIVGLIVAVIGVAFYTVRN